MMATENSAIKVEVEPDVIFERDDEVSEDSEFSQPSPANFEANLRELQKNSILNLHNSQKVLSESHKQVLTDLIKAATDFKNYQMQVSYPAESNRLEQCIHCGKFYRRLARHMLKHTKTEGMSSTLVCQLCFEKFEHRHIFEAHLKSHNISGDGNTKPFVCEVCQKGFSQNCNLINHLRTHTGDRPFKCDYCDKRFTQSGNLKNHMRLHNDEKPYVCPICFQSFRQLSNLNNHSKKHPNFKQSDFKRAKAILT